MDANRFDHLTKLLSAIGSRRSVVAFLATLPLLSGLLGLLGLEETEAKDRRRRRKRRHRRRSGKRKDKRNDKRKGKRKNKNKKKRRCTPDPVAQTCAGKCGTVTNNCQQPVDCGSCACDPPCPTCQVCQGEPGVCVPRAVGTPCGEAGQVCRADGTCGCEATSCPACTTCGADGRCAGCGGCQVCEAGKCVSCGQAGLECEDGSCCLPDSADLQAAITAADPDATLRLCAGTWDLTVTLSITKDLTLIGAGAGQTTLDGGGDITVLSVAAGAEVRIEALTIANGRAGFGAGIFNDGTLTLRDVDIIGNTATRQGGGIYSNGTVILEAGSRIAGNIAEVEGGGIRNNDGVVTLKAGSLIGGDTPGDANSGIAGGGILSAGTLILEKNSRVAGNTASNVGGGVYVLAGTATLQAGSHVDGNSATNGGGGIRNLDGTVTLESGVLICDNLPLDDQCLGTISGPGTCPYPAESCPP